MRAAVAQAIEELKAQFAPAVVQVVEDGEGGARVLVEGVALGPRYQPSTTWIGGHITPQYPYADIYPLFVGADLRRVDGVAFVPPITPASFEGRPAWQVSRRSPGAHLEQQKGTTKFLKVIHFLQTLP